jgi:hypothetical protein
MLGARATQFVEAAEGRKNTAAQQDGGASRPALCCGYGWVMAVSQGYNHWLKPGCCSWIYCPP